MKRTDAIGIIENAKNRGPIGEQTFYAPYFPDASKKQKIWFNDDELKIIKENVLNQEVALTLIQLDENLFELLDKSTQNDIEFLCMALDINRNITKKLSAKTMNEMLEFIKLHKDDYAEFTESQDRANGNYQYLKLAIESENKRMASLNKKVKSYHKTILGQAKKYEK